MKTAIIACVKCEERYIREWIEWHISMGFDHFFLADNNDINYNPTLESIIFDYIDRGVVTIVDCKGIVPIQPKCYNLIMEQYGNEYDWYAMIDVDEFFCLPKHGNIKNFLASISRDTDIVHFHWRYYNDNNLLTYDKRLVQERFTEPVNTCRITNGCCGYVKSIFRNKSYIEKRTKYPFLIDDQHTVIRESFAVKRNVLGDLYKENQTYDCNEVLKEYDVAYIKHFVTKTVEEYIEIKRKRGRASLRDRQNVKYSASNFFKYNKKTLEKIEFFKKNGIEI